MKAWQGMCVAATDVAVCSLLFLAANPVRAEVVRNDQFSEVRLVYDPLIGSDEELDKDESNVKWVSLRAAGDCLPIVGCVASVEFDVAYYDPLEAPWLLGDKHGLVARSYDGRISLPPLTGYQVGDRYKATFTTWVEFTVKDEEAPYLTSGPNHYVQDGDPPIWSVELHNVDTQRQFSPKEGTLPEGTYRWEATCYAANPDLSFPFLTRHEEIVHDMWVKFHVGWLQQYTFGDWARDQGYAPGAVMPNTLNARPSIPQTLPKIDRLDGIGAFDWTTTTELILDYNQISSIESGDFDGLGNLETLKLWGNLISSIESGDFEGLENLKALELRANQISSIKSGDFDGLENLEMLDLSMNQISSIESGDFDGLENLERLYLHGNRISNIQSVDLKGLTNLSYVSLGNQISSIESGDFDGLENLEILDLSVNQISSIESDDFDGLENLESLYLSYNQISSIESDDFSGLPNLHNLHLRKNKISSIAPGAFSGLRMRSMNLVDNDALIELNLTDIDFSELQEFDAWNNDNVTRISLKNTVMNQTSLSVLIDGGDWSSGMGNLDGVTELDLSGIDFVDVTDLGPLYVMDHLIDLWLVDTKNLDAFKLDTLLDNLATIQGTEIEGILHMTQADFDAFNTAGGGSLATWDAEPGHHVEFLQLGDVNHDSEVNDSDVEPFVDAVLAGLFDVAADVNEDGFVDGLDVAPFVAAVIAGGTQPVPEPSTLALTTIALLWLGLSSSFGGRFCHRRNRSQTTG